MGSGRDSTVKMRRRRGVGDSERDEKRRMGEGLRERARERENIE